MKFNIKDFPTIFGADKRKPVDVKLDDLATAGVQFASYGIRVGDIVQFPDADDVHVKAQPIREGSTATQYLIAVMRGKDAENMKPDWLALGSVCRVGVDGQSESPVSKEMAALNNHKERVQALVGKTITATGETTINVQKFEDGRPVTGETVEQKVPVITYA